MATPIRIKSPPTPTLSARAGVGLESKHYRPIGPDTTSRGHRHHRESCSA
jgi:hypothetical protein